VAVVDPCGGTRRPGEHHGEVEPWPTAAAHGDVTAHRLDERAHDVEPDAHPAVRGESEARACQNCSKHRAISSPLMPMP